MKLRTPRWWYERRRRSMPIVRALLTPVAWIWAATTAARIARGTPFDPGVPVICVGNLTVGGSGKTPVARALARQLAGRQAHILIRGYGGRLRGPVRVDPNTHTAEDVGDEALMLAADLPVWVARDRLAGAAAAVADGAGLLILDDGHQSPSLRKSLSLIVVDGETRDDEWPFGDGAVFPAGPMREPLEAGLARADAVVVLLPADLAAVDPALAGMFPDTPTLIARLVPLAPPPAGPQMGFAGIAKPWKMERALKAAGCDLVDFAPLPDHRRPDRSTLAFLKRRAVSLGAELLTSEKDWVRLSPDLRAQVAYWPVAVRFDDAEALDRLLTAAIG